MSLNCIVLGHRPFAYLNYTALCWSPTLCSIQALKRDLSYMEQDARAFAAAVQDAATTDELPAHAIQQLKGNFRFLWGMYKAHSEVSIP